MVKLQLAAIMTELLDRSKETINWDEDKKKECIGVPPSAKYGAASESMRHTIPEHRACAMFCKGKKCKYENVDCWSEDQMEIKGLYSNWITENILAMARPNTHNVQKYDIIKQFKESGITSIINLQLPGEHASCGPGLDPGGFTYSQQEFMDNDIFFYNFGWQDYGVGSLTNVLDMVKVMQFALSEGKVAIHCHAGLGRTGVLIACYLVYANRMHPDHAVHFIRSKRPPSIQTRSQILCIQEFAQYLEPLRVVFSSSDSQNPAAHDYTLHQFLIRQKHILHGVEARKFKFIPKIIYECCENLIELAGRGHARHFRHDRYEDLLKTAPSAFNNLGPARSSRDYKHTDSGLSERSFSSSKAKSVSLESFTALNLKSRSSKSSISISRSGSSMTCNSEFSDSDSVYSSAQPTPSSSDHDLSPGSKKSLSNGAFRSQLSPEDVAGAMAETDYDEKILASVSSLKEAINQDSSGYAELRKTGEPRVLAKLIWDWLDDLKEPVLHAQDLPHMLQYTSDPQEGLKLLNRGAKHTLELIFKTIAKLEPLSDETERSVVQRVLSTLTHQNMVVEMEALLSSDQTIIQRTSNNTGLMRGSVATKLIYFFMHLLHLIQNDLVAEHHKKPASKTSLDDRNLPRGRSVIQPKGSRHDVRRKSLEAEDAQHYQQLEELRMRSAQLEEDEEEGSGSEDNGKHVETEKQSWSSNRARNGLAIRGTRSSMLAGIKET